jgi:3-phosphoshikimate 1-carboxyvinyltransferase
MNFTNVKINVPGSKSITNRVLIISALAQGTTRLENFLKSNDTEAMVQCLKELGVEIQTNAEIVSVVGVDGTFKSVTGKLFANQSGTTGRFILPALLVSSGKFEVDGDTQLRNRPFGEVASFYKQLGVSFKAQDSKLPFTVDTTGLTFKDEIEITIDGSKSSQFLSGILMVAPVLGKPVKIKITGDLVSTSYVHMTIKIMECFGAKVSWRNDVIEIQPTGYVGRDYIIEPDASSASYFFALGANLSEGIEIEGLTKNSLQGDVQFVELLQKMGAIVDYRENSIFIKSSGQLNGVSVDMEDFSDTMPTLAAVAPLCKTPVTITGVEFIRHKESDRIQAMFNELTKLGVKVTENQDGLYIEPSEVKVASNIELETYDDHRIAMSLGALLKLSNNELGIIKNPSCVNKTFPTFWDELKKI